MRNQDKEPYVWVYLKPANRYNPAVTRFDKQKIEDLILERGASYSPLYSIEDVKYVLDNNELPKVPVAYVVWDDTDDAKIAYSTEIRNRTLWDNKVSVFSADELLEELQKPIEEY